MKKLFLISRFYFILLAGPLNGQYFVEPECGFIADAPYSYENYTSGYHAWGFRLFHNNILIYQLASTQFGTGYNAEWMKFVNDNAGFLQYTRTNPYPQPYLLKFFGDSVREIGMAFDSYILNAHTVYTEPYMFGNLIYKWSDVQLPNLLINGSTVLGDTTVTDTILGVPLCNDLQTITYDYQGHHYTIQLYVVDSSYSVEEQNVTKLCIYPNPSTNLLHLETDFPISPAELRIYNCLGVLVRISSIKAPVDQDIDVSGLSDGLYYLELILRRTKVKAKMIKI